MKVGVISDTHGHLDQRVLDFFAGCDEIWHAGDIGDLEIIDKLERTAPVKGVYGNIDDYTVRSTCPENQCFTHKQQKILITHIAGKPPRYNARVRALLKQEAPDLLVCGHSHILRVEFDAGNNVLYINPGAAGVQGFHKHKTAIRFTLDPKPTNMEVLKWDRTPKTKKAP